MALPESSCKRADDTTGKDIKTYLDPDTLDHIQAIALDDDSGNQLGIATNPLHIQAASLPATEEQETVPTDTTKNNPSFSYTYAAGDLTQIDMVISGTTYRRTLTYAAGDLTAISVWSAV